MDEIIDLLDSAAKSYPMKALADEIGKAESTLRNELTEQPGYKTGLRTAIKIWDKTRDLRALDMIESRCGRVAFVIPTLECGSADVLRLEASAVKEFGEQMEIISKSIADGRVSRSEAKKCVKEVIQAITALARIKMCLEGFTGDRP